MPFLEQREILEFLELAGIAAIRIAKGSFSLSNFHTLMDALRKFAEDAFREQEPPPTLKNCNLARFLRPDGFIDKAPLFGQIKSELLVRTQNLLEAFLDNKQCYELSRFLLYEENAWNERPMKGFGPKYRNDLTSVLLKYGLKPGMTERELQDLLNSRWR